jgi:lipid II:glycine glycyltransferase (peptidoglycan interpeptide bridge formation enzyme)
MWRLFHPPGYIRLFIAEVQGEAVAAHLVIPFGKTLISKLAGWSGRHGNYKPNEVLEWEVIKWAKTQGFHTYDFEGIERKAAETILNGEFLPTSLAQTPASFKMGFGGQVVLFPEAYDYVPSPVLRGAYNTVFQKVRKWSVMKQVVGSFRTRVASFLLWLGLGQLLAEVQVVGF